MNGENMELQTERETVRDISLIFNFPLEKRKMQGTIYMRARGVSSNFAFSFSSNFSWYRIIIYQFLL